MRGAFTGAVTAKEGFFEAANGGTLFLDEVGDMSMEMQAKPLRAIESRTIRRVGETDYRAVDVRIVAASWKDLREMVNAWGVPRGPLLPSRGGPGARAAAARTTRRYPDPGGAIAPVPTGCAAADRGAACSPREAGLDGNMRALRNVVFRAAVLGWPDAIAEGEGSASAETEIVTRPVTEGAPARELGRGSYYEAREEWQMRGELEWVKALLERYEFDYTEAAIVAGLHHTYLRRIAKRLGL